MSQWLPWIGFHALVRLAVLALVLLLLPTTGDFSDDSQMWLEVARSPWQHMVAPSERFAHLPPLIGWLLLPAGLLEEWARPELALRLWMTLVETAAIVAIVEHLPLPKGQRTHVTAGLAVLPTCWLSTSFMGQDEALSLAAMSLLIYLVSIRRTSAAILWCATACLAVKAHFLVPLAALLMINDWRKHKLAILSCAAIPFLYYGALWSGLVPGHECTGIFETVGWFSAHAWGPALFSANEAGRESLRTLSEGLALGTTGSMLLLGKRVTANHPPLAAFLVITFTSLLTLFGTHYLFNPEYLLLLLPLGATLFSKRQWWLFLGACCCPLVVKLAFAARYAERFGTGGLNAQLLEFLGTSASRLLPHVHFTAGFLTNTLALVGVVILLRRASFGAEWRS